MKQRGIHIQPGFEHFINLKGNLLTSSTIRALRPEQRDCFFSDEGNLEFYNKYTLSNCKLECGIKASREIFHCVPWYLPRPDNKICDPWTARNFSRELDKSYRLWKSLCAHCLPNCEEESYSILHTQAKFRCCPIKLFLDVFLLLKIFLGGVTLETSI